jgi:hypothetical protein
VFTTRQQKGALAVAGVISLAVGLSVELSGLPVADPFVWIAAWCWLVGVGLSVDGSRRENAVSAALLTVTSLAFTRAWIGTVTWRTTTFPTAAVVLGGFGGALAVQLLAHSAWVPVGGWRGESTVE